MQTLMSKVTTVATLIFCALPWARASSVSDYFYSDAGREHEVSFDGIFRSTYQTLDDIRSLDDQSKNDLVQTEILPLMGYLFGPLVNRTLGSPLRAKQITVDWDNATLVDGNVNLAYHYDGIWIVTLAVSMAGSVDIPVPYNTRLVYSPDWKMCSDRDPEHQTTSFYWYFWDPARSGCDQQENREFTTVHAVIGTETQNTSTTYPEYDRMVVDGAIHMTFGFGYVHDPSNPSPDTDSEEGAYAYRGFLDQFRSAYGTKFTETPILQGEYPSATGSTLVIGHRFSGKINGNVNAVVNVVMSAGVDQMEIFAQSFAHDHDAFFGWFGHSRVGSGFDAQHFARMLDRNPSYYSLSTNFQVVYWAGCNSYSYYTEPFFSLKGGSSNLNIIANGLPTYFTLNADDAMIAANAFLNLSAHTSYQSIVNSIEERAKSMGETVLVAVLGDETNPQ